MDDVGGFGGTFRRLWECKTDICSDVPPLIDLVSDLLIRQILSPFTLSIYLFFFISRFSLVISPFFYLFPAAPLSAAQLGERALVRAILIGALV